MPLGFRDPQGNEAPGDRGRATAVRGPRESRREGDGGDNKSLPPPEKAALRQLLNEASTVSISPLFQCTCKPNQMTPIPWEHWLFYLGLRMEVVAMPSEQRSATTKPFG